MVFGSAPAELVITQHKTEGAAAETENSAAAPCPFFAVQILPLGFGLGHKAAGFTDLRR